MLLNYIVIHQRDVYLYSSNFGLGSTGRTNHADVAMLPNGEWPQWCRICGGSGLDYCLRCHGTGEYREPMGFHFTVQRK
ncbi:DnaJ/Hsp40 cysteine-rich domain superfamily protein [Zea mays]|uniref:DnaJ/Hsp40 cysteine-rich domain superfamily protein n=1 Tax=Zea mays TaxID=4577 RepID=A0A1D6E1K5_MAIZE|nr:DnaJ/Hsp40 cysteine-rich domain superfamily protein [Zea mays]